MEVEVRAVAGRGSCYAALPLSFIQVLESTSDGGGPLPPVLALELRARDGRRWHLAWCGAASQSPAIEVAQQFAECISLPDHSEVQVKAVANLPKAEYVTIDPSSEDDWEILELNSELAEESILKQVGIVHEGMRFPLWLHEHITVTFLVVSTSPRTSVVQLVPGTEVAFAPKKRKKSLDQYKNVQTEGRIEEQYKGKALLRVQATKKREVQRFQFRDFELGVLLTSVAFMHSQTAEKLSFDNLQLVTILPRLSHDEIMRNGKETTWTKGNMSPRNEENYGLSSASKEAYRRTVIRIIFSDSVAKGHIMLPQSLRVFLRTDLHSWVYVKKYSINQKKDIPSLTLSPCRLKSMGKNSALERNGLDSDIHTNFKSKNMISRLDLFLDANVSDCSLHEKLFSSLSCGFFVNGGEKATSENHSAQDKKFLLHYWLTGQLKAIASYTEGVEVMSVFLSKETLLHFELKILNLKSKNEQPLFDRSLERGSSTGESVAELLYILTAKFEESSQDDLGNICELALNTRSKVGNNVHEWQSLHGKLELGEPVSLNSVTESYINGKFKSTISSLSWMEAAISDVTNRLTVLLSPYSGKLLSTFGLPLPGHVLIHGPSGSGKTSLAMAVAKCLEEHEEILAHVIFVSCSKLSLEKSQAIRQAIANYISEALAHSPTVIIFDDLDHIVMFSSESEGSQPSSSVAALAKFFTDIMDEYGEKYLYSCGYGPIAFVASVQSLGNLPQSLSSSGRFDFHVQLAAPAASERGAILKHEIHKRALQCSEDIVSDIASKCDGYDAYDLELLVDRAVHAAISRFLSSHADEKEHEQPTLTKDDLSQAMHEFVPVSMRGLTKSSSEGGRSGWEDVGGLLDIRNAIQEMVELPSKFPNIFAQSPLRLRSNVLLYGPPGCGKTHIVGAAAAACSLRFISVKGPELLNKYIGASEQAVRDLFSKAAAAAPCLLFFDEFDSIAPKRGHDNTGVTDRVVNQLLTELDGVEALTGVFVFAATSRPDLLDAALLRPGRLDRLLFCDFPSWHERLDILRVLSGKLSLASNIDLETIASMTEGFSGADLQALLSDAQLASVHEVLDNEDSYKARKPVISDQLLKSVASRARPSVSEAEKRRLNGIYSQLDLKKSIAEQARDAKGKKATLA